MHQTDQPDHTSQSVAAYEIADSLQIFTLGIIAVGEHLALAEDKTAVLTQLVSILMLISFVLGFSKINWSGVLSAVTGIPDVLFFIAWIALMGFMGWYRKNKFKNEDAKANWTAQIINAIGQTCLLLCILFA